MRGTKRIIIGILTMLIGLTVVTACGNNQSPESVAKAYISASARMDYNKMVECNDYTGDYKSPEAKKAAKALFEFTISSVPEDAKLELKSYKFKSYEKMTGEEVEEIKEIGEGKTVAVTGKEIGKVTVTYKKNGKGETLEKTENMIFIKVDGKWYKDMESLVAL